MLDLLKQNGGVVCVTLVEYAAPLKISVNNYRNYINCSAKNATVSQLANHIDYIKNRIGVEHVGIGTSFDSSQVFAVDLYNASMLSYLPAELIKRGYVLWFYLWSFLKIF